MANGISARLSHEIREAKLCLDGDSPNLQMALDRLSQMESEPFVGQGVTKNLSTESGRSHYTGNLSMNWG